MTWRWVNRAASVILALVVLATLGGGYLFYRAMPAYSGTDSLPGLSAEVRVWRDHFGVPHIFAPTMDDAARTLGYIHASERMFQMEIMRRVGQGRMAEIRGAALLGVDHREDHVVLGRLGLEGLGLEGLGEGQRDDRSAFGKRAVGAAHHGVLLVEDAGNFEHARSEERREDRVAAERGVIGHEDDRVAVRWDLHGTRDHPVRVERAATGALPQRHGALGPEAHPYAVGLALHDEDGVGQPFQLGGVELLDVGAG